MLIGLPTKQLCQTIYADTRIPVFGLFWCQFRALVECRLWCFISLNADVTYCWSVSDDLTYLFVSLLFVTNDDVVAGVCRVFSSSVHMCMCMYVCVYVCQQSKTKTSGHIVTKIDSCVVYDKSWSPILFEVRRLNVKVTGSVSVMSASNLRLIQLIQTRSPEATTVVIDLSAILTICFCFFIFMYKLVL